MRSRSTNDGKETVDRSNLPRMSRSVVGDPYRERESGVSLPGWSSLLGAFSAGGACGSAGEGPLVRGGGTRRKHFSRERRGSAVCAGGSRPPAKAGGAQVPASR